MNISGKTRKVPGSVQTALRASLRHLPEKQQPPGRVYPCRHGRQPWPRLRIA